jgi:hypothetical protein
MKKSMLFLAASGLLAAVGITSCQSTPEPVPTADKFTGPDVLWRPRQQMIFYLDNARGGAFDINFSIRDMNVYQQGARPAYVFVTGPKGKALTGQLIPDDGIVKGKPKYQDGYYDIGMDMRYRSWHRQHSPGGIAPGKERSPYLANPEKLKARKFKIKVSDAGKGIYRVYVGSCWDHWISITPSRPMSCGVYPGLGSMYVPKGRLKKAYIYVPENTKDISFATTEEVKPFNWKLKVSDMQGKTLAQTKPKEFLNYAIAKNVKGGSVLQLSVDGKTTGACLHIRGLPPILCASAVTARKIAAGAIVDDKRLYYDPDQKVIMDWAKSLKPSDLRVVKLPMPKKVGSLSPKAFMDEIKKYQVKPGMPKYGMLNLGWRNSQILPYITDRRSIYYNNAALVKRIWLYTVLNKVKKLDPTFSFAGRDYPKSLKYKSAFQLIRSSWWPLNDLSHAKMIEPLKDISKQHIPPKVIKAMNNLCLKWALSRMTMEQGLCSNQWTYELIDMAHAAKFTGDPKIKNVLDFNVKRFCTPNNLGRSNPDPTPYSDKSKIRYTYSSDTGRIGGGVPAECLGHDSEYGLESNMNMARVWAKYKYPEIVEWLDNYYVIKSFLTLPKTSKVPKVPFSETCSPADMNTRTRYYTHKSGIAKIHDLITYGPIWEGKKGKKTWPCMQPGTFFKNIDNRWFFVKTPTYYAIVFGGAGEPPTMLWNQSELKKGSGKIVGYGGMGYGGYQRAKKPGGFSAIWLPECGPISVGSNHNVMYTNTVWGRVAKPLCKKWADNVDPRMVSECFSSPTVNFDSNGRCYMKSGTIPNIPLKYTRTIKLNDDSIAVTIKLTATKTLRLRELNESIPLFLDDRTLAYRDKGKFTTYKIPKYLVTPTHKSLPGKYWGINPAIKPFNARAIKLTAPNGSGMLIELPRKYNVRLAQPLRYRSVASTMSGLILSLPKTWKKNQTRIFKYKIKILSAKTKK